MEDMILDELTIDTTDDSDDDKEDLLIDDDDRQLIDRVFDPLQDRLQHLRTY